MTFASLGLAAPLLQALETPGYKTPTPIQLQAIPAVLAGRDLMAAAQTGTGKTAGFALPVLQRLSEKESKVGSNAVRCLVLVPTRELAEQVHASFRQYGEHLPVSTYAAYGGVSINPQMMRLRRGVDVLVATPGRLLDLFRQNALKLKQVETLILDEADRMLDLGFSQELAAVFAALPKQHQTLLFSATFSEGMVSGVRSGLSSLPICALSALADMKLAVFPVRSRQISTVVCSAEVPLFYTRRCRRLTRRRTPST